IREFLCSEAMHHLHIPTSRALSLISLPSRTVYRESPETGAVVCRLAPTWIRFGSFELFSWRGDVENLRLLADYVIEHHFDKDEILKEGEGRKYTRWYGEVVKRTAELIAHWQAV
ncbi:hypothetical protein HK102_011532, partial [Quaeritorhiza haematococci]